MADRNIQYEAAFEAFLRGRDEPAWPLDRRQDRPGQVGDGLGQAEAIVATRSDLVISLMHSPFGRDLITVGYGAQVQLQSTDVLRRNPHEQLLNLLAPPRPRWRK